MSKIKCIIVEDEPLATKILEGYIAQVPFLELQASFEDAIYAMEHLKSNSVDLIFLDIHLPKVKGMAFIRTLANPPAVIITTAYHQYAVEGYELNVIDYLLKPFEFDRFLAAVNKLKREKPSETSKDYLFVNIQLKKVKIRFADILYIESQKEYVKIVTRDNSYLTKMSTHEIEQLLPDSLFQRIHRSYIVALDKITSFNSEMVEVSEMHIPVGRGYKDVLEKL